MAESWALNAGRRRNMQANRNRDTKPELRLRRLLHARGLRYRVATRPLPEARWTADIVFTRAKVAVFVDGCYWHGCPEHFSAPKRNPEYWGHKIEKNRERDRKFSEVLENAGWTVIRAWEHEDPADVAVHVERVVRRGRSDIP